METSPTGYPGQASVPTWLLGQASPIELAILLAIQEAPDHRISLNDLASKANVSHSTACHALNQMERRGWLTKQRMQAKGGGNGANRYVLKVWPSGQVQAEGQVDQHQGSTSKPEQKRESGTVPIDLLVRFVAFKGAVFVYVMLQRFQAPTISLLATVCAMAPNDVRRALRELEQEGWIQRIDQPGSPSLFRVFFERVGAHRG
ncbi:MAG: MarR family transcriptional regulator [Synechococcaceae cyanobacterium]|nr:MarR family transcriptional regulator [Synechococcaceae cyanobacterium]